MELIIAALCLLRGAPFDDPKHDDAVFECAHARSFCFDLVGKRMVCVNQRNEMIVIEENATKPIQFALEKKEGASYFDRMPMGVACAGDGKHALVAYYDGRVQLWDFDAKRKVKDLDCKRTGLTRTKLSSDGKRIAVLARGKDGKNAILIWKTEEWALAHEIEFPDPIVDFCFAADDREIRACAGYPTDQKEKGFTGIVAWDAGSGKEVGRLEYGSGFPVRIAASPDGKWVACGGGDAVPVRPDARRLSGHLRIFDWENKTQVAEPYQLPSDYVRAVQFSPDGKSLYAGHYSSPPRGEYRAGVKAFAAPEWNESWSLLAGRGNPHELALSPDGEILFVPVSQELISVSARHGESQGVKMKFRFYPEDQAEIQRELGGAKK